MLERHHPKYWNGSVKQSQSFLDKNISISEIQDIASQVINQNRSKVSSIGANGVGQIFGNVNGVDYVLGFNRGRIGQLYPA